jgi:hypothetical protein
MASSWLELQRKALKQKLIHIYHKCYKLQLGIFTSKKTSAAWLLLALAILGPESENSGTVTSYSLLSPSMCVQKLAQILLQNVILEKIATVQSDNHFLFLQTNVDTQFTNYT